MTIWHRSMGYGYIMAAGGQTWYANADDVRDGAGLWEGKTVTFTGSAVAPEGRSYPGPGTSGPQRRTSKAQ